MTAKYECFTVFTTLASISGGNIGLHCITMQPLHPHILTNIIIVRCIEREMSILTDIQSLKTN